MLVLPVKEGEKVELEKGPNIAPLPQFEPLPDSLEGPVLLKLGDNISTDEIMPAGEQVLPYRSNIPAISKFVFARIDETYHDRAMEYARSGSLIVAGRNYGQGSSREHAAIAPRYLGLKAVIARSFARIHWQNLVNFGILPLTLIDPADWKKINQNDVLVLPNVRDAIHRGNQVNVINKAKGESYATQHAMTDRQVEMVLAGSLINLMRERHDQ
jgi:aconitate hydratase